MANGANGHEAAEEPNLEGAIYFALVVSEECAGEPGAPVGLTQEYFAQLKDRLLRVPEGVARQLGVDLREAARQPSVSFNPFRFEPRALISCLAYVRDEPEFTVFGYEGQWCGEAVTAIALLDEKRAEELGVAVVETLRRAAAIAQPAYFMTDHQGRVQRAVLDAEVSDEPDIGKQRVVRVTGPPFPTTPDAWIFERHKAFETEMRGFLSVLLVMAYGENGAAKKAMGCWDEKRRDSLVHLAYGSWWTQLTFSELIAVVRNEWQIVERHCRPSSKVQVLGWLEHIGECRNIAFHRDEPVPSDFVPLLKTAYAHMEQIMRRYRDIATLAMSPADEDRTNL